MNLHKLPWRWIALFGSTGAIGFVGGVAISRMRSSSGSSGGGGGSSGVNPQITMAYTEPGPTAGKLNGHVFVQNIGNASGSVVVTIKDKSSGQALASKTQVVAAGQKGTFNFIDAFDANTLIGSILEAIAQSGSNGDIVDFFATG